MKVLNGISVAIIAAIAFAQSSRSSLAQAACAARDEIVSALSKHYKENPAGIGLAPPGRVFELYVSDAGTWTLLLTTVNGRSCVIGAGENWETNAVPVKGSAI